MGEQVNATLDDDIYDKVCEESRETGRTKSKVVNQRVRAGYNGSDPTLGDTVLPQFGQGLFIAGFIVAFFSTMLTGVVVSVLGMGVIFGAKVDEYARKHDVSKRAAFKRVWGV